MAARLTKRLKKRLFNIAYAAGAAVLMAGIGVYAFQNRSQAPVSEQVAENYQKNATAAPGASPSASSGRVADRMLGTIQKLVQSGEAGPLVISILGDSTGNGPGEWADLWAQHLTKYGTVTLHQWDDRANDWAAAPKVMAGNAGRVIEIWNGSQPGSNYTYPLERLNLIQPAKPAFVILNFGHNIAPKPADIGSAELMAAVDAKWGAAMPAAITLQNPAQGAREVTTQSSVTALAAWAPQSGYPTINVNKAFIDNGGAAALLEDEVHPNRAGSKVWADAVIATLG